VKLFPYILKDTLKNMRLLKSTT